MQSLQAELELPELVVLSAQEKLRARKEFEGSKEYKDKLKVLEKLSGEARNEAISISEKES